MLGLFDQVLIRLQTGKTQAGLSGLAQAHKLARAALFQVAAGDLKAIRGFIHGPQAQAGHCRERCLIQQHTNGLDLPAPYPTAQLVQLSQTETLGMLNNHQRSVRDIHPHFDDGRGDQHVQISAAKGFHDLRFFCRGQTAMNQADPQRSQGLFQRRMGVDSGL